LPEVSKQITKVAFSPQLTQDLLGTEIDEGCLVCRQFQVPDGPSMETFMVQVKVRTENPIFFWVASKHYKYGGLRLKFGLHFKYKTFYVKIKALPGRIQDDQGTQWKGTCEGDG